MRASRSDDMPTASGSARRRAVVVLVTVFVMWVLPVAAAL
jgi:hypothetical protein